MRRLASAATILLLGGTIFAAWMHPGVLDPRRVGWLLNGQDRGASAIGLAAYLRAGAWPSLHQPLLAAPEGLTLLFTDSIPLLGVLLGPFGRWLGGMQFLGLWLLACTVLQTGFAWLLLRPHARDRLTAVLATALLAAMPALLNRYGHPSLCAQWLVLWSLWVFVDPRRARWWPVVIAVAALVHSYLLLMVLAIWASAVLRRLVMGPNRGRTVAGAAAMLVLVAGIAAWHGVWAGGHGSTGTYGAFPMALDALWNPANPGYAALIPSSPEDHGRGFEGLQYLGAGLLLVVVAGIALRLRGVRVPALGALRWLVPAFAVLAVVAIGPQPLWRGSPVFTAHLPAWLIAALDPVRAGGRLAWPITYTLAYAMLATVLRWRHAALLLGVAVAVQLVDLSPMLAAVRTTSAAADDARVYRRTLDPRWPTLVAGATMVEFEPADPFIDLQVMEEVAWRAVSACRPVRYFYAAREASATRTRVAADRAAFLAGRIDPGRLYILLDRRVPAAVATRVTWLDGIAIIAPTRSPPPPICVSPTSSSSPRSAS